MRRKWALLLVILAMLACQIVPTPPPLTPTSRPSPTSIPPFPAVSPTPVGNSTPIDTVVSTLPAGELPPFPSHSGQPFADIPFPSWQPSLVSDAVVQPLPEDISELANPQVIAGLSLRLQQELLRTGFVIVRSREAGFAPLRQRLAQCFGQPYYLTTDAAFHAFDTAWDAMIPLVEQEELHRRMIAVLQATLDEILDYLPLLQNDALLAETYLAAGYLAVGLQLLDPHSLPDLQVAPELVASVASQVEQILAARGLEESVLIPGFQDDFSLYSPRGHYLASSSLQAYYRGMAWLNRVVLRLDTEPSGRAGLILTLALRRAQITPEGLPTAASPHSAAEEWVRLYETMTFLYGGGLDYGPAEYAALMDQVYPEGVTILGLADGGLWERFRLFARELPPQQLGATSNDLFTSGEPVQGWRWLSHSYRLEDSIINRLQGTGGADLAPAPGPLDLMAALGSQAAVNALGLERSGSLSGYFEEIEALQERIAQYSMRSMTGSADDIRLFAYRAQIIDREAAFSIPQRALSWQYKDLNSALGAWVQHRSELAVSERAWESPTPTAATHPVSGAGPAYVEPAPEVFFHLGLATSMLAEGLLQRGMTGVFSPSGGASLLQAHIQEFLNLGERLHRLGEIASDELVGTLPDASDWTLITAPLSPNEVIAGVPGDCLASDPDLPQTMQLVALQSSNNLVRYAATGLVDRIFVLVQLEGRWMVAQGGVFSYYEFPEDLYGPLTGDDWLRLQAENLAEPPVWTAAVVSVEGSPVDVLAFHAGSVYRVSGAAGRLNLRREPGRTAAVLIQLTPGMYFTLIEGPIQIDGFNWWKVSAEVEAGRQVEGWLVENQTWYLRIW